MFRGAVYLELQGQQVEERWSKGLDKEGKDEEARRGSREKGKAGKGGEMKQRKAGWDRGKKIGETRQEGE